MISFNAEQPRDLRVPQLVEVGEHHGNGTCPAGPLRPDAAPHRVPARAGRRAGCANRRGASPARHSPCQRAGTPGCGGGGDRRSSDSPLRRSSSRTAGPDRTDGNAAARGERPPARRRRPRRKNPAGTGRSAGREFRAPETERRSPGHHAYGRQHGSRVRVRTPIPEGQPSCSDVRCTSGVESVDAPDSQPCSVSAAPVARRPQVGTGKANRGSLESAQPPLCTTPEGGPDYRPDTVLADGFRSRLPRRRSGYPTSDPGQRGSDPRPPDRVLDIVKATGDTPIVGRWEEKAALSCCRERSTC